jgi:hypothetical protein
MRGPDSPKDWEERDTERVLDTLRVRSKGLLELEGDRLVLLGSVEQIRARAFSGADDGGTTRSASTFRLPAVAEEGAGPPAAE